MARLAIVDDSEVQRRLLTALLEKTYAVSSFPSGDAFLAAMSAVEAKAESGAAFDLVLLDIEMPGSNGYETCRQLKAIEATADTPVIFVSAHDDAPERVAAYEAGGDDFIVKPVAANELKHKVGAVLHQRAALSDLAAQSRMAQQVAFTAMTNIGELGVLLDFMRRSSTCSGAAEIADALLAALEAFGLSGAVQVRDVDGAGSTLDRSSVQQAAPLQATVMESMRDMGRIFVFGSRGIVNYARISLLANNLPTDNEDHLGRLRDNLALLAEGAEIRLEAIEASAALGNMKSDAVRALAVLRNTLAEATARAQAARQNNQYHTVELLDTLSRLVDGFDLTPVQRETISDLIHEGAEQSLRHYDESAHVESDFENIVGMLEKLAKARV